jgi:uncharacterized GH25 family protein
MTIRASILLFSAPLLAHDLYIVPSAFRLNQDATVQVVLRNGPFPGSLMAPALVRLRDANVLSINGSSPITGLAAGKTTTTGTARISRQGNVILTVRTVPNTIEMEPHHFTEHLRAEGHDDALAWRKAHHQEPKPGRERYSKFAKALLLAGEPSDFYRHRVGFVIEIIPEANPYLLKPGDHLPVQVLYQGRPIAGVLVDTGCDWQGKTTAKVAGRTGADGRVLVPIPSRGLWMLHAVLMERREEATADWESYWASLTFEVR